MKATPSASPPVWTPPPAGAGPPSGPAPADGTKRTRTIERAALILTCFSVQEPRLTLGQLAAKLDLNQSTVYRYVQTLLAAGLLERAPGRGGYQLGLRVVELAYVAMNQLEVRKAALDEMERLRDELGLLINLGVRFQGDVLKVAQAAPGGWPTWKTTVGNRLPAECTALGKVLLAHRPWDEARAMIEQRGWRPATRHSVQDLAQLAGQLEEARERGYAVEREECVLGGACVAAPIRDHTGAVVAALSITGPLSRLTETLPREIDAVREAANRISLRLGYDGVVAFV